MIAPGETRLALCLRHSAHAEWPADHDRLAQTMDTGRR
jgi:hypothetical protein